MAVMFFFVNLALFFNNYVNPVALEKISWKYYIVYVLWLAVEFAFVYFFFVETRYTPLEEINAFVPHKVFTIRTSTDILSTVTSAMPPLLSRRLRRSPRRLMPRPTIAVLTPRRFKNLYSCAKAC